MSVSSMLEGVKVTNALWLGIVVLFIYKLVTWYKQYTAWVAMYDKLPGKREKHWLWGHIHEHPGPSEAGIIFSLGKCEEYEKFHRAWITSLRCMVFIYHPDVLKQIFKRSEYEEKSFITEEMLRRRFEMLWRRAILEHPGPNQAGLDYQLADAEQFPRFHALWFGRIRCIIISNHPDVIKKLLKASAYVAPKPRGPGTSYEVGIKWLGEGLLIANGDRWARNRRLLTPAFHFDILQNYAMIQNQCTGVLLGKIEKCCEAGTTFEAFNYFGLSSLDVILKCAFSYKTDCQIQGDKHPYVQAVSRLTHLWMERSLNPLLFLDFIYFNFTPQGWEFSRLCKFVHGIAEEIIKTRKNTIEEEGLHKASDDMQKRSLDFLDIILTAKDEEGRGLSDLDIRNEVDTFLFEGHDTTTSAISWIMYSLAQHQDIQERCRSEIDSILKGRDSDYIEWSDLGKFDYLTMCIKEGLRCHSPIFFIQRQVTEDFEIEGYKIPAWTNIAINIYNVHHNSTVWGPDHMEYKPDRFLHENISKMDTFAFIPFSAGQRNCIGQNFAMNEIKIVVARLLHRYRFELDPDHEVKKRMGVVMRAENGILLKPSRR